MYNLHSLAIRVHSLTHLADDVLAFGSFNNFSAFRFENHMQTIKRVIRKKNNYLVQLVNRVVEAEGHCTYTHNAVEHLSKKYVFINNVRFSSKHGDRFCMLKNEKVVCIQSIEHDSKNVVIHCKQYNRKNKLKCYPCNSTLLSIFLVEELSHINLQISSKDIASKCFIFPYNDVAFICIPMLNT